MKLLLDTHVLLWWLTASGRLSRAQRTALEKAARTGELLAVSAITLWEIAKLVERGRLSLDTQVETVLESVAQHAGVRILPLEARVALESTRLGAGFPRDPADQIIVATARVHGIALLTADERIRESRLVAVI